MSLLPLSEGAHVAIVSPSGRFDTQRLEAGLRVIEGWGLRPVRAPGLGRAHRYLAGSDEDRLEDLIWAMTAPDVDAVWIARGGYGLARLLSRIPWDSIRSAQAPRPVIGFSDSTALFCAMWVHGLPSALHAPVLHSLADHVDDASREACRRVLMEPPVETRWSGSLIRPGSLDRQARGPLLGGNLCTMASLAGTGDLPSFKGAVLLLEEVAEAPYRIDRMLVQLLRSGAFDGVAGVVLGQLVDCDAPAGASWRIEEVFAELLPGAVPVMAGMPVGHGADNHAFPWGAPALMDDAGLRWRVPDSLPARTPSK